MKQIDKFWKWFQDNEQALKNAFFLGINREEVLFHFNRNLNYVSTRIGFVIKRTSDDNDKSLIIFTGAGYRKLFPKLIALEEQAPKLELFRPQAFIKPMQNTDEIKQGNDDPIYCENYILKLSEMQFSLLDFNVSTKQLKLTIYLLNFDEIETIEQLYDDIRWLLMEIIGEINYKKHIKDFELVQMPNNQNGLLDLIELQDYIDYLCKIDSGKKTRYL
ncbi:hypothetical protein [Flavobacterium tegetincola]|uniref:hypothetical protein n=1 Tax=Flavobacterium tegetincola TaxID=150172 RepID=UPI0004269B1A|nr:hypothetical protein [Flavobacterium tegetincola]